MSRFGRLGDLLHRVALALVARKELVDRLGVAWRDGVLLDKVIFLDDRIGKLERVIVNFRKFRNFQGMHARLGVSRYFCEGDPSESGS